MQNPLQVTEQPGTEGHVRRMVVPLGATVDIGGEAVWYVKSHLKEIPWTLRSTYLDYTLIPWTHDQPVPGIQSIFGFESIQVSGELLDGATQAFGGYHRTTSSLIGGAYYTSDGNDDPLLSYLNSRWYTYVGDDQYNYTAVRFDPTLDLEFVLIEYRGTSLQPCDELGNCEICADPTDSDYDGYQDCADACPLDPTCGGVQ